MKVYQSEGFDPVDKTAAMAVSGGTKHTHSIPDDIFEWESCPPIRNIKKAKKVSSGIPDLTGVKFGNLTVVGLWEGEDSKWVCQCSCGMYVIRNTSAIRQSDEIQACFGCNRTANLRRSMISGVDLPNSMKKVLEERPTLSEKWLRPSKKVRQFAKRLGWPIMEYPQGNGFVAVYVPESWVARLIEITGQPPAHVYDTSKKPLIFPVKGQS